MQFVHAGLTTPDSNVTRLPGMSSGEPLSGGKAIFNVVGDVQKQLQREEPTNCNKELHVNVDPPNDGVLVAVSKVICTVPPPELNWAVVRIGAGGM